MIHSLLLLFVFVAPPSRQAKMRTEMCVKLLRPPRIALLLTAMLMLVLASGSCLGQTAADKQGQSAIAPEQQGQKGGCRTENPTWIEETAPVSAYDRGFDHWQDIGDMLNFIQCDRHFQASNEAVGIAFGSRQNARIIEGEILTAWACQFRSLHQGAFSRLAGAID
jgi:hypothetical protein